MNNVLQGKHNAKGCM